MGTNTALGDRPADRPASAAGVLAAARAERKTADQAEARLCRLAVQWVVLHPEDGLDEAATYVDAGGNQTGLSLAGPGAPRVAEYAVAEFAAAVGVATEAGKWFLGECLELRYRLPRHWDEVVTGQLPAWKARRVARETMRLSVEAAGFVDAQVAPVAGRIKPAQLDRTIHEAIGRYMPGAQLRAALGSTEPWDVCRAQAVGDLARGQYPLDLHPDNSQQDSAPGEDGEDGAAGAAGEHGADGAGAGRRVPRVRPRQVVLYIHLPRPLEGSAITPGRDPVARLERGGAPVSVSTSEPGAAGPPGPVNRRPGRPSLRPRPRRAPGHRHARTRPLEATPGAIDGWAGRDGCTCPPNPNRIHAGRGLPATCGEPGRDRSVGTTTRQARQGRSRTRVRSWPPCRRSPSPEASQLYAHLRSLPRGSSRRSAHVTRQRRRAASGRVAFHH